MSPKRRPGWVPSLGRYRRTGQGRVRIPGRGDVYLGPAGCWPAGQRKPPPEVVEAYNREIARWASARAEGREELSPGGGCTVTQLAVAYYKHCQRYYTKRGEPTTHVRTVANALKEIRALFGSQPAETFGARDLRTVRDRMERGGAKNRETINSHLGVIRKMFRWAASEEIVSEDVWLRLRAVAGLPKGRSAAREPGKVPPVPAEAVEAVLPHLPAAAVALVRVQQLTGMRPEEVCGMQAGDLDTGGDVWRYAVRDEVNKLAHRDISRVVWLGPRAQAVLAPFLAAALASDPPRWIFRKTRGRGPITPGRLWQLVNAACRAAGVEHWHPNQLRHLRGTETRRAYGLEGTQAELGHTQVETSQIYAAKSEELAKRIARETG